MLPFCFSILSYKNVFCHKGKATCWIVSNGHQVFCWSSIHTIQTDKKYTLFGQFGQSWQVILVLLLKLKHINRIILRSAKWTDNHILLLCESCLGDFCPLAHHWFLPVFLVLNSLLHSVYIAFLSSSAWLPHPAVSLITSSLSSSFLQSRSRELFDQQHLKALTDLQLWN